MCPKGPTESGGRGDGRRRRGESSTRREPDGSGGGAFGDYFVLRIGRAADRHLESAASADGPDEPDGGDDPGGEERGRGERAATEGEASG